MNDKTDAQVELDTYVTEQEAIETELGCVYCGCAEPPEGWQGRASTPREGWLCGPCTNKPRPVPNKERGTFISCRGATALSGGWVGLSLGCIVASAATGLLAWSITMAVLTLFLILLDRDTTARVAASQARSKLNQEILDELRETVALVGERRA